MTIVVARCYHGAMVHLVSGTEPQRRRETMMLMTYDTAETVRAATDDEARASIAAAARDGGAGVITVDGVRCYVETTPADEARLADDVADPRVVRTLDVAADERSDEREVELGRDDAGAWYWRHTSDYAPDGQRWHGPYDSEAAALAAEVAS